MVYGRFISDRPALVVWGVGDPYIKVEQAWRQRETFPRAQVVLLDGCGHWPMLDEPDRLAEAVVPFLAEQGSRHPGTCIRFGGRIGEDAANGRRVIECGSDREQFVADSAEVTLGVVHRRENRRTRRARHTPDSAGSWARHQLLFSRSVMNCALPSGR